METITIPKSTCSSEAFDFGATARKKPVTRSVR